MATGGIVLQRKKFDGLPLSLLVRCGFILLVFVCQLSLLEGAPWKARADSDELDESYYDGATSNEDAATDDDDDDDSTELRDGAGSQGDNESVEIEFEEEEQQDGKHHHQQANAVDSSESDQAGDPADHFNHADLLAALSGHARHPGGRKSKRAKQYVPPVTISVPYPVHIERKVPVFIETKVPVYVEKKVEVPVERPYGVPVPVKVPVYEKEVIHVPRPVLFNVDRPYPVYVHRTVFVNKYHPFKVLIKSRTRY